MILTDSINRFVAMKMIIITKRIFLINLFKNNANVEFLNVEIFTLYFFIFNKNKKCKKT